MSKLMIILISVVFGFISCSKDKELSKTELLTGKTWIHDGYIIDWNNNLKPDDVKQNQVNLTMKFNPDNSLVYTFNGNAQHGTWSFELNESVIRFKGLESDTVLSASQEFIQTIYQLDKNNLIFDGTTATLPERLTFILFK